MNLTVSTKSQQPIYEQVYDQIASQIVRGELPPNFCLPSIRNIAKELNISIITIKSAWEKLEQKGLIYTVAGKGCFVAEHGITTLDNKKFELAQTRLDVNIPYYKSLGISIDELIEMIKRKY